MNERIAMNSLIDIKKTLVDEMKQGDYEGEKDCDIQNLENVFNLAILALEKQIPKGSTFHPIFKIMVCDCGARTLPGQRFCTYCGHKLDGYKEVQE